jgi:FdhD protein
VTGGAAERSNGILAPEALVRFTMNDAVTVVWSCTPDDLHPLAVGWLVSEGFVHSAEQIRDVTVRPGAGDFAAHVAVRLDEPTFLRVSSALGGAATIVQQAAVSTPFDRFSTRPASDFAEIRDMLSDRDRVAAWFRDMFDRASLRTAVGGVHTGGLAIGGELRSVVEDVSRHHVVDRLVGTAWSAGVSPAESILLVSSRISGAMAAKACRAGVGALVSRSIPSVLAASVARRCGLIMVGRARRENPHYHWPDDETASE